MASRVILLIDGHAVMYRSFYAIPPLTASDGTPTNAVLGFVRLMRRFAAQRIFTHWMVVFDGGLSDRRKSLLPEYKAQRSPMPDLLRPQFDTVTAYLDLAGIPWLRAANVEGDDLLAVMTRRGVAEGDSVGIATSDKDMFQLVGPSVWIIPPSDVRARLGAAEVAAKTGVAPERVVEWLALTGDTSDNIDGIAGVGVKTAARLLTKYGSLQGIWENIDHVQPERIARALKEGRAKVERNLELISLGGDVHCDVPGWERMAITPEHAGRVDPFFRKLELQSLVLGLQ